MVSDGSANLQNPFPSELLPHFRSRGKKVVGEINSSTAGSLRQKYFPHQDSLQQTLAQNTNLSSSAGVKFNWMFQAFEHSRGAL